MPERDQRQQAGILHPARSQERIDVGRAEPSAGLAPYVDYFWWVTWQAPQPHRQEVIPRGVVHVSAEIHAGEPRLLVHGVHRTRFERVLAGEGRTVAAAFRPGGFRPFLRSDVSALCDREVPAADLVGVDDKAAAARLLDSSVPVHEAVAVLAAWLEGLRPEPDPMVDRLAALVEQVEVDSSLTRAEEVASLAGVSLRTLQRQFAAYVGIGPKWVVQRCRLLDVAVAAHTDARVDWAALAADLGYADQSHLIRAFTAFVGHPPATYAAGRSRRPGSGQAPAPSCSRSDTAVGSSIR